MAIGYIRDDISQEDGDFLWWEKKGRESAQALQRAFARVEADDGARIEDYKRFTRIYENRDYLGLSPSSVLMNRSTGRSVYNITRMVIDTLAARIAKSRPHGRAQTVAGNRSLQRKARLQERWVESEQYRSGMEREAPDVFLDAAVYGTGIFYHYTEGREIKSERCFPGEVFVDAVEGYEGAPDQYYRSKWVSRAALQAKFPDKAEDLAKVKRMTASESFGREPLRDQVRVIQVWKVACGKDAGWTMTCCEDVVLQEPKPYKHEKPPLVFIRWATPRRGFWGIGLVEELIPLHLDINITLQQIQKNLRFGNFQVWLDAAGRAKAQKLTNEVGAINYYRGERPTFTTLDPVSNNLVTHLNQQIERAFAQGGVSADSVASQNTLGADASGKARRTFYEQETQRYSLLEKQWEWLWMDTYKMYLRLGKELSQRFKDYTVVAQKDRYTVEEVPWDDVDLETESYVIRVAPVSALPTLPSEKLATVQEMFLMQIVDKNEARALLDWPDLERAESLAQAASDNIDRHVEIMLDEGRYISPSPFMDLQLALKKVQAWEQRAECMDDVPFERLALLRKYVTEVHRMTQLAAAAQAQAVAPTAPGVPPGPGSAGQAPTAITPGDGTLQ